MAESLSEPVALPCGLNLPNRLVKAALAESMSKDVAPSRKFENTYRTWARGGWGAVLTGNVMVDDAYLGTPRDLYTPANPSASVREGWARYAAAIQEEGTPALVQLNHPGRQSPIGSGKRFPWTKNVAPSPVPLNLGDGVVAKVASAAVFGTPRQMTLEEIRETINKFAQTAKLCADAGFAGVQIHAAHGYLLAQFLSPHTNRRTDAYGGNPANRARIVAEVVEAIRKLVPKTFCVAVKLNSADHQNNAALEDTLEQIQTIVAAGVDFLEVSGGTYEDPQMIRGIENNAQEPVKASTAAREAFFLDFAQATRKRFPDVKLMLTGGFRSRKGMEMALAAGACDIIGLGRPSVVNPSFPKDVILNSSVPDEEAQMPLSRIEPPLVVKLVPIQPLKPGIETVHYSARIRRLAKY